ncbi:MAG: hypothetical protein KC492_43215 [Myxococcales bacterium]|nr:hypothetical protein [Myxococcales bacterium]MCB9608006.1 hypothetical protein [Polyangiaceae bacterium]
MLDFEALLKENAAQSEQIARLVEQIASLNDRIRELLAVAQRKRRKPAEPKAPPPPPVVDAEAKAAFEARPKPPVLPPKERGKKKGRRPTGRKPMPEHLEAEEHQLRPDCCEHCGSSDLDVADEVVEEKLHVVKEHQRRRVVKRKTCR